MGVLTFESAEIAEHVGLHFVDKVPVPGLQVSVLKTLSTGLTNHTSCVVNLPDVSSEIFEFSKTLVTVVALHLYVITLDMLHHLV